MPGNSAANPFSRRTWTVLGMLLLAVLGLSLWRRHEPPAAAVTPPVGETLPLPRQIESEPAVSADIPVDPLAAMDWQRAPEPFETLLARLLNASLSEKARHAAVLDLARLGTGDALDALKTVLADAAESSTLKAAIAEALGECQHPDARPVLVRLAGAHDETVARGAIRGLAALGDSAATHALAAHLENEEKPVSVRAEAALALGMIEDPAGFHALKSALSAIDDPFLARSVLEGIGHRPFDESREFFSEYLRAANVAPDLRAAALEAIGNAPGDVTPFLLGYAADSEARARAAAAWSLAVTEERGGIGPQLVELLQAETEPSVRLRLYQALIPQGPFDVETVQRLVASEADISARLEGYNALARALVSPGAAGYFDQHAVPQLVSTALDGVSLENRLASVVALQRARTPAAQAALAGIVEGSSDSRVVQAAQAALARPAPRPGN